MLVITSSAFANGQPIPQKYSAFGENVNPELSIVNIPEGAKSLALIMHDPDAPMPGGFTHWVVYNIEPQDTTFAENSTPPGTQGLNDAGKASYTGPRPPSGTHHYHFTVYALDIELQFDSPPHKTELESAMQGHILQQADLVGLFAAQ